jgi:hypothetical protein
MKLVVLGLILLFALGFFILAAVMREDKRFGYALLAGFITIMIGGLMVAGFGLEYPTGATITDNGNTIDVTDNYTTLTALELTAVAMPLIITGFWGLLVVINGMRDSRYEADDE